MSTLTYSKRKRRFMELYQAPMEGITSYIFRNALEEVFGGVDKYFTPFIAPYEKRIITEKEIKQLCPDNNNVKKLVPQIITMDAVGCLDLCKWLNDNYGYEEFNLNFGCPSGTVVSKGRGAGALQDLSRLKAFLDELMESFPYKMSIKTRLGMHSPEEFARIMEIYNEHKYEEIIVHPRVRDEMYKGLPHTDVYKKALQESNNPFVYNGNVYKKEDYDKLLSDDNGKTKAVMIGRGMLANPAIFREIRGKEAMTSHELEQFLTIIREEYTRDFSGEIPVLHKMKEIWEFLGKNISEQYNIEEKVFKGIRKSKRLTEYLVYEKQALKW